MPSINRSKSLRLQKLEVINFKGIDQLSLTLPPPRMKSDPDIFVMGSRNGLGKTSILEACTLLFLMGYSDVYHRYIRIYNNSYHSVDFADIFIKSGTEKAIITGVFVSNNEDITVQLTLSKGGKVVLTGDVKPFRAAVQPKKFIHPSEASEKLIMFLAGVSMEPVMFQPCLYFHSFRKVQEGHPELGMMLESDSFKGKIIDPSSSQSHSGKERHISTFKLQILRAMMGKASLFETMDEENSEEILAKLNSLVERYAGGTIEKLRPTPNNTIDFRITPKAGGNSITFDALSSGQKEMISTLFLIWKYSMNQPSIVLVDEPELHLNAEWHRDFVQQVFKLAPNNQYIIATHSEDIFRSVDADRRILLERSENQTTQENSNLEE